MTPIFLSASVPDPRRDARYHRTGDVVAIRSAVEALCEVVFDAGGMLVFGGHPAISPFVRRVAARQGAGDRVRIFQSEYCRAVIPVDSQAFDDLVWTPAGPGREESLLIMRERMLATRSPEGEATAAGVFIGGMEGVEDELDLFLRVLPQAPAWLLGSTGGAAGLLLAAGLVSVDPTVVARLAGDRAYDLLFEDLLGPVLGG